MKKDLNRQLTESEYKNLQQEEKKLLDSIQQVDCPLVRDALKDIQWHISKYEDENMLLHGEPSKTVH